MEWSEGQAQKQRDLRGTNRRSYATAARPRASKNRPRRSQSVHTSV